MYLDNTFPRKQWCYRAKPDLLTLSIVIMLKNVLNLIDARIS